MLFSLPEEYNFAKRWSLAFSADDAQAIPLANEYLQEHSVQYPIEDEEDYPDEVERYLRQESSSAFQKELAEFDDHYMLRSIVWAHCKLLTHKTFPLSADENHQWCSRLAQMLERTAYLSSANLFPFQGVLQSMRLYSLREIMQTIWYPWEAYCQTLMIDRLGSVSLSAKTRDPSFPGQIRTYSITSAAAQRLFEQVTTAFTSKREDFVVFEAGTWELELINTDGHSYLFEGDLYGEKGDMLYRLSNLIRETLGTDELFAFDENCQPTDPIRCLRLEYRKSDNQSGVTAQPDEWLILNNDIGTVEWVNQRYTYGRSWHRYELSDSLSAFLRHFGDRRLFQQPKIPAGELISCLETIPLYTLTVEYADNTKQVISGHYDQSELPEHFSDLIEGLTNILKNLENGSMMAPTTYAKTRRRQGQLIYCSVSFHNGSKTYYYRTEDDSFHPGNEVVVPAGKDNHPALVKIEKVEYFAPENVPLPVEQTKAILRHATIQDRENFR